MHSLIAFIVLASTLPLLSSAWIKSPVAGPIRGFNYDSTTADDFRTRFTTAYNLAGVQGGFNSARLYTMIAPGASAANPAPLLDVFQPAIDTKTSLLLGLYCSAGDAAFNNELSALKTALGEYGDSFKDLVVGISVGSEDLYRTSVRGTPMDNGAGDSVDNIKRYIGLVRQILVADGRGFDKTIPVGHVDTWQIWQDPTSAGALISTVDFIGLDGYPYWQNASADDVGAFTDGLAAVTDTATNEGGVPVWVTETGFPNAGDTRGPAVPSAANAAIFWQNIGCQQLFGKVSTWWYILNDGPAAPGKPSFGITDAATNVNAMFDLKCGS